MSVVKSLKMALLSSGLTQNELDFYITALQHPFLKAYEISKQIKLSQSSGYRIFESLCDKKLLTRKDNQIIVLPLSGFIEEVDKKHRNLFKASQHLKENVKFINLLKSQNDETSIEVFRGEDILEKYFEVFSHTDWEYFVALGDLESFLTTVEWNTEKKWISKRVSLGKRAKAIFSNDTPLTQEIVKLSPKQLRKMYIDTEIKMPDKYINLFPGINTSLFFTKDEFGPKLTAIKSKDIVNSQVDLFQHLWDRNN